MFYAVLNRAIPFVYDNWQRVLLCAGFTVGISINHDLHHLFRILALFFVAIVFLLMRFRFDIMIDEYLVRCLGDKELFYKRMNRVKSEDTFAQNIIPFMIGVSLPFIFNRAYEEFSMEASVFAEVSLMALVLLSLIIIVRPTYNMQIDRD